jgi:hypothetical protein
MYNIRVEFPNNLYSDFQVSGTDIPKARATAEQRIRDDADYREAKIEWRGLVAFVNREP